MFCKNLKTSRAVHRIILILTICSLFLTAFSVNAAENSVTPPNTNTKIKFVNYAHTDKVLNIYSSTPSSGNSVSIYSWSNNATQWWKNVYLGKKDPNDSETRYYKLEVYSDSSLGLAFDSGTVPAYIHTLSSISSSDYELKWLVGNSSSLAYRIKLYSQYRLLGVTAANSDYCYWFTFSNNNLDNATSEENWLFYTVT